MKSALLYCVTYSTGMPIVQKSNGMVCMGILMIFTGKRMLDNRQFPAVCQRERTWSLILCQARLKNNSVSGGPPDWDSFSLPVGRILFLFFLFFFFFQDSV